MNPEHKELVKIMQDAGTPFFDNLKAEMFGEAEAIKETSLYIAVGRAAGEIFYPYLESSLKNPRIVDNLNCGSGCPLPTIKIDKTHTICLNKITDVHIKTESIEEGDYSFIRYCIDYKQNDLDYTIHIVLRSK